MRCCYISYWGPLHCTHLIGSTDNRKLPNSRMAVIQQLNHKTTHSEVNLFNREKAKESDIKVIRLELF